MNIRDQYHLVFQKAVNGFGDMTKFTTTDDVVYSDLALHLTYCDDIYINAQLETIDNVLNSNGEDFFWGEVMGSAVEFHSNNTVEIGDGGFTLPILDFKELLKEWLTFIS